MKCLESASGQGEIKYITMSEDKIVAMNGSAKYVGDVRDVVQYSVFMNNSVTEANEWSMVLCCKYVCMHNLVLEQVLTKLQCPLSQEKEERKIL